MIRLLAWCVCALCASAAHADVELVYQGYMGGAKAGRAHVRLVLNADDYAVEGRIRTRGLFDKLTPWHADFTATGRFVDGQAVFEQFEMTERDRRKHRIIKVAEGVLKQVRNGEVRPEREAPGGVDVYSALWITTHCFDAGMINNGRRYYEVKKTGHELDDDGVETCHYDVVNKDGELHTGMVRVEERAGRRVPVTIEFNRGLRSRLELISAERAPPQVASRDADVAARASD